MADVARWVDVQDVDDVAQALMEIGNQQALDAWAACTNRPDNTMGSVYGTAETLLDVYGDPVVASSAEGCDLDLDELLTGPTTPSTSTPQPASKSASGRCSSSWFPSSSGRPRSWPPPNPTAC
jgi:hypothetical protein